MCHHQLYVDEKCVTAVSQFRKIFSVFKKDGLVHPSLYASPLGAPPTTSPSPSLHGPPPTLCRPSYPLICFLLRFCMGLELCRCWSLIQKKKMKNWCRDHQIRLRSVRFPPRGSEKRELCRKRHIPKNRKIDVGTIKFGSEVRSSNSGGFGLQGGQISNVLDSLVPPSRTLVLPPQNQLKNWGKIVRPKWTKASRQIALLIRIFRKKNRVPQVPIFGTQFSTFI